MKKSLLIGLSMFATGIFAQNDSLLPNLAGNYAYQITTIDHDAPPYPFEYTVENLTILPHAGSTDSMYVTSDENGLMAHLKYIDNKVLVYPVSDFIFYLAQGEVLYDFNLQPGDSAYTSHMTDYQATVVSVDQITIGTQSHKRIILDNYDTIVQGIGSLNYFFRHPFFESGYKLCSAKNYFSGPSAVDTIKYNDYCLFYYLDNPEKSVGELKIYPNPSNDGIFYIEGEYNSDKLAVTDQSGRNISVDFSSGGDKTTVTLRNYSSGIYFVTIQTENDLIRQKIVIRD